MNARKLAGVVAAAAMAASAWALLSPRALGGATSYAAVTGSSMRPRLVSGDLAVLRSASSYVRGDVVAYRASPGSSLVLHRIIAVVGDRYVVKGDANAWVDADSPARSQVIGKMWFSVPRLGGAVGGPARAWIIMALAALVATTVRFSRRKRTRGSSAAAAPPRVGSDDARLRPSPSDGRSSRVDADTGVAGVDDRVAAAVCVALAATFLATGALTFASPAAAAGARNVAFAHEGSFSYSASVPRSAAYPSGRLVTGDPVFIRLVDHLELSFAYQMRAAVLPSLAGALILSIEVRDDDSRWSRTLPLGRSARVSGWRGTASARVDVRALSRLLARVASSTGLTPSHYVLTLRANVAVVGTLGSAPLTARFTAALPFTLNELTLLPALTLRPGQGPASAPEFTARGTGSVGVAAARPATFFGVRTVPMRAASGTGTLVFIVMAMLYARRARIMPAGETRLARRVERLVVEANSDAMTPWRGAVVSVASMHDLGWIAEQRRRPILRGGGPTGDRFEVRDGDIVYRCDGGAREGRGRARAASA